MVEAFSSTPKAELIHRQAWPRRAEGRRAIVEFVEVFYNNQWLHSALGYLAPAEYERWPAGAAYAA